jgi:hypothetical protein
MLDDERVGCDLAPPAGLLLMGWEVWSALVLGFATSAIVQAGAARADRGTDERRPRPYEHAADPLRVEHAR